MKELIIYSQRVRKFYFLEYYFILLDSINRYSNQLDIFEAFKKQKSIHFLGESRYKKLTQDDDINLTKRQIDKYKYTFEQVILEAELCGLIKIVFKSSPISIYSKTRKFSDYQDTEIYLKENGHIALEHYKVSKRKFNLYLLKLLEKNYNAFYHLINLCYQDTKLKNGLMVFPVYSPLKLGFQKPQMTQNKHIIQYSDALRNKLEDDIRVFTNKRLNLFDAEQELLENLYEGGLMSRNPNDEYEKDKFNAIINRFRKHWLNFFLTNIYKYEYSYSTFSIWVERGKQIGVLNTTEFFPDFSGRIVYPTSIIADNVENKDFLKAYIYNGEGLYIHSPDKSRNSTQEEFVKHLTNCYFELKKVRKTHFINLLDVKEKVCFKLRIPSFTFDEILSVIYKLNLSNKLPIQISLEADKLPHETSAMYLKREPILVNEKLKNIIAINYRRSIL